MSTHEPRQSNWTLELTVSDWNISLESIVCNKDNLTKHNINVNMKKNDVIAIIIIILFIILAAVSFGIWKLVSMAKNHMSVTGSGTSSSHSSRDIAD